MESLHDTATRVLRQLLANQPVSPGKIALAWQMAAGPALARSARISAAHERTLRVRAKSPAWRSELQHARPMILARLKALLGPGVIDKLEVD
jgi:predicted nucleic acid-binding Zn ribbon protein